MHPRGKDRLTGHVPLHGPETGLGSLEESTEASGDGRPGKVGFVGGTTAGDKIRAIRSVSEDSNQSCIEVTPD